MTLHKTRNDLTSNTKTTRRRASERTRGRRNRSRFDDEAGALESEGTPIHRRA